MTDAELLDRIARLKEVADSSVSHDTVAHYIASPAGCTYLEQLTEDAEFLLSLVRDGLRLRAAPQGIVREVGGSLAELLVIGAITKELRTGMYVRIVPEESNV